MTLERLHSVDDFRKIGRDLKKNSEAALNNDLRRFLRAGYSLVCTEESLCTYLSDSAQGLNGPRLSPRSLSRFLASLSKFYNNDPRLKYLHNPAGSQAVKETLDGIYQRLNQPIQKAKALSMVQLNELCERLKAIAASPESSATQQLLAYRDRAIIACAFWRGLRGDTIGSLKLDGATWEDGRLTLTLPREKQSRTQNIREVSYERDWPLNPCQALKEWIAQYQSNLAGQHASENHIDADVEPHQPVLFPRIHRKSGLRSTTREMDRHAITKMLRDRLPLIGIKDPSPYSAHSLRHSLGVWGGAHLPIDVLMRLGGWQKMESVMEYIQNNRQTVALNKAIAMELKKQPALVTLTD